MRYVDIGIPANNKGKHSIGCLFWLLARMVLQMRGTIRPGLKWDVMVNFFFFVTVVYVQLVLKCEVSIFPRLLNWQVLIKSIVLGFLWCRLTCSSIENLRRRRSKRKMKFLHQIMPLLTLMQVLSPMMDNGLLLSINHGMMQFQSLFQQFLLSTGQPQKLVLDWLYGVLKKFV